MLYTLDTLCTVQQPGLATHTGPFIRHGSEGWTTVSSSALLMQHT